ncbi:isopenicillin N synthase family oxygenase [Microbacterium sp. YMB-B2]|uniref:Isopenicillin N synthase family oxygenase n=1 Tax=Microbacterium tenebrionis TaxID=2830665 RepID=A0A9X1LNH9_9MICO|nr:2-oxoglutarate and iron-dependent oxygenase domain-containing protein [Microbacterium tenebrionis]MCC2029182.1 isopenicillin N synthase family oxygenase [Microbacterium tenebrionis]
MADLNLPILDLSDLDKSPEDAARFREDLAVAAHDVGFFYLVGTGIEHDLFRRLQRAARDFFALPEDDKLAIENVHSPQFRGYTRIGGELTQGKIDWREQIDIGPERESVQGGPAYNRLIGPNLWPAVQPELREVAESWQRHLTAISRKLLSSWAEALGAAPTHFDAAFEEAESLLKIVRYPGTDAVEPQQGVGIHKDGGVLTLLWVEPGKGGLQVERGGEWVDAPPVDDAFIVNIGEMLEYATGGYLKATKHRVISPKAPDDRVSVPFFFNPALNSQVPVIDLPDELRAQSRGVSGEGENPIDGVYGENALRYRLRAHPNVVEIHHADLANAPS